jgi:cell division protein FtsI (penicillin-binding protein 3)
MKKQFSKPATQREHAGKLKLNGSRHEGQTRARSRITLAMILICGVYGIISARLVYFGLIEPSESVRYALADPSITARRPDLVDRNGMTLGTDINTASLYAEPRRIVDVDEAIELLSTVLPDLNSEKIYNRLSGNAGFVWLRREITPAQQSKIHQLGIPGIGFKRETRRFYPNGPVASHLVGHVNIDNVGIAGAEKVVDERGLKDLRAAGFGDLEQTEPVELSIDIRVQSIVHDELQLAMERYRAIAAGAVVLDVHTGEVIAMASLPDYDSNKPADALDPDRLNRMSAGLYEMGSTFKAFTTAMALDSGLVNMRSRFDASKPLRIAGFTINDFHGKKRVLSVPEIFIYSSNIGTAKMADVVGMEGHQEFLHRVGLLDKMPFELAETATPVEPKEWKKLNSVTISYGHGVTTTPLQTAVAGAALINGGKLLPPTLFKRTREEADALARQVIKPSTSDAMRYLFRLNVEDGSGRRADVDGYWVGGKTGTAEKVVRGRYSSEKRFNAFLAAFPINDPKYMVLTIIDEPKPEPNSNYATAGMNAAPMVSNIVRRSAPILGIEPHFGEDLRMMSVNY